MMTLTMSLMIQQDDGDNFDNDFDNEFNDSKR